MKGVIAAALLLVFAASANAQSNDVVMEFRTMAGVSGPYVGTTNPIRAVPGGGRPWKLEEARGELRRDGRLEIHVKGLVLTETGANPVAAFRGLVSCLTIDNNNLPAMVNVSTDNFPASTAGDSDIEAMVALPAGCFAPIIFVTSPAGSWFAVTGY